MIKKNLSFLTVDDAHGVPHQVLGRVRPQQRGRGQQQEEQGQDRKKAAHVKYQDIGGTTQLKFKRYFINIEIMYVHTYV